MSIQVDSTTAILPMGVHLPHWHGLEFLQQGNASAALEEFNRLVSLHPCDPVAYEGRGLAKAMMGAWEYALEDYTRSIELNPARFSAYLSRGWAISNFTHKQLLITTTFCCVHHLALMHMQPEA